MYNAKSIWNDHFDSITYHLSSSIRNSRSKSFWKPGPDGYNEAINNKQM